MEHYRLILKGVVYLTKVQISQQITTEGWAMAREKKVLFT